MKIEFGCGERGPKDGFIGQDVRSLPNIEFCCNAWDIQSHVEDNSVEEIYSRHFLEHLTWYDVNRTLKAWHDILVKDGMLVICVPDIEWHINQWRNPRRRDTITSSGQNEEERAIEGFWGKQRETDKGETWDIHKSGYDYSLMSWMLREHQFRAIKRVKDKPKNLTVQAIK